MTDHQIDFSDMTVVQALTAEIERQNLSLNELSVKAEVAYSRMHDIVHGKTLNPGFLTVHKILIALGKSLTWLDRELKKESPE